MRVITTTSDLNDVCDRFSEHSFVAVDTEFIREQTFWPRLCVIQLAGPGGEAIVDPLAKEIDLAPFYGLMANERVVKVFHAARQDLEIVWTQARLIPRPIFDTQVAAMVCGFGESVSYVSLVKQITGANLDKTSRFTDWARRPLSEKQLAYALADVTHLRDIYRHLVDELEATGRVRWLDEEMAGLTNPETYETRPEDAWKRLKLRVRNRKGLAVLMEVAAWRDHLAQTLDVPRNRILRDEALYDIASHAPAETAQLAQLRSLSEGFARSGRAKDDHRGRQARPEARSQDRSPHARGLGAAGREDGHRRAAARAAQGLRRAQQGRAQADRRRRRPRAPGRGGRARYPRAQGLALRAVRSRGTAPEAG